jgi:hypothetical protein
MSKENWVGGPNAWFDRTDDLADEKNMAESIKWTRMIGEGIKSGKNFWAAESWKFDSNGF